MKINMESLDVAIAEFNGWNGASRIYLDMDDGMFEASVYMSNLHMESQLSTDNYICVYYKDEINGRKSIGERRKDYIEKYSELVLGGYDPMQAKYRLSDIGIFG